MPTQKTVSHSLGPNPGDSQLGPLHRAVDAIIAKNGVIRASETWLIDALRGPLEDGALEMKQGDNAVPMIVTTDGFESFLFKMAEVDERFLSSAAAHRRNQLELREEFNVESSELLEFVEHLPTSQERMMKMISEIDRVSGTLEAVMENNAVLTGALNEALVALENLESRL